MKIFKLGLLTLLLFSVNLRAAQIDCLSQIFQSGKGILDLDGDGFPETPKLAIVVPDTPNIYEMAVASDLAARLNLEALAVDFSCVWREADLDELPADRIPVLIGTRLQWIQKLPPKNRPFHRFLEWEIEIDVELHLHRSVPS